MKNILLLFTLIGSIYSFSQTCTANAGPDTIVCTGTNVTIGGLPAAVGSGTITYTWTPATNLSCTNCPNPVVTANSNQTYTLTIQDDTNCVAVDQMTVTVNPLPIANFSINNNNACANLPIAFTNTSSGTGLSYSWNFGDPASGANNTSTATNPTHFFQAFGTGSSTFTVVLTVTNSSGCSANFTQTVTVQNSPNPSLIDPITSMKNCGGGSYTMTVFDASSTTSISNYQINWGDGSPNFNAGTFPGAGVSHNYSTSEIFTMSYIITGTNGCVDTALYNVANITNPAIGAANPGATTGCGPVTLCFPLNNYASNHSTTFYVVDYGDNSPLDTLPHPPPATICHTYSTSSCGQPGNQFVFAIKAINLCDSSEATISPIRVYMGPTANFNPAAQNNCVGSTVTFINSTVAGFNSSCSSSTLFQWNFGNGQTLTTAALTNPTTTYSSPGTYTVTLTTTNSCGSNTITRTVCIENPPVPDFTVTPASACIPFVATMTDASNLANTCNVTRQWSVIYNGSPCTPASAGFSFVGGTSATSINPQIQFTQAGNYTVRLTLTNSCGSFFIDRPVVAQKPPQVTLAAPAAICAGTSTNPVATVIDCLEPSDTYAWTFTGGSPATANTLVPGTISYPSAGTYPITFAATNACGTTSQTVNFTVNTIPPALNAQVNSPVCVGQAANFTSNANPSTTYSWSGPNGFTAFTQNFTIPAVTAIQGGSYTVIGSIAGCPGPSSSVNLVVLPIPVISVTPPTATICIGDSVNLTASGASTYSWAPATGLSATNVASVNASPPSTQTYTITGSNGSCSGSTTATVTVNPLPIVNAGPDTTVCDQPIAFQLSATPTGGTWTGANVSPTGLFTPNGVGAFNLTYTFTNGNGCTNTDQRLVTVIPATQPNAGNDTSLCLNSPNVNLVASPIGGTWTGTNITSTGTFSPTTVGTHTLVYHFGAGTCLLTDTVLVTVNPLPIVNAGLDTTVCIDAGTFNLIGNPLSGTWTGTGVTNPSGIFNPAIAGAGTFNATYNFTDVNGCSANDIKSITVNPLPIVNAGPDSTACNQPLPFQLGASPLGGTWSGSNVSPSGVFTPNGIGTFTLTYTFTNANGCTNFDTRELTIADPVPVNAGPDFAVCLNAPTVSLSPTPIGGTWSGSNVTAAGVFTPSVVNTFELVYTTGSGSCILRDTLIATVNPLPLVDAGANQTVCISAGVQNLVGSPVGGTWSGTGITNTSGEFTPATAGAGTFNLTYSFTDANTCSNSDVMQFTVNPLPLVNAGNDTTLCNQPIPVNFAGSPAGGTWSGTNTTAGGTFTPSGTGTFTLTYTFTNGNGCTASDTKIVTVNDPIQPNAGADFAVCIDAANVVLAPTPLGGTWTGTNVTSGGIFDPTTAGTFTLVYSLGQGTCLIRDTLLATVNPLPIVDGGLNQTFCLNAGPQTLSGLPSGGSWTGTGITNPTGEFTPATAGVGTHTVNYNFTDVNGCFASDPVQITVNPLPLVNAGNDTTLCNQPIPVNFTASPAGGTWSGTNITAGGTFTPNGTGIFTLTYTFTNGNGCTAFDTKNVTVNNPIIPNAGSDLAVCIDAANVVLVPTPLGGTWTGTNTTTAGIFDPTTTGTFPLVYTLGQGNCLIRDTMLMTVNPLPIVDAGLDFTQCIDAPSTTLSGTPSGGTWSGIGVTSAGVFTASTAGAGTHTLTYSFTDLNGCSASNTLFATINPLPIVNAGIDTTLCNQAFAVQFNATPAGGTWSGAGISSTGSFVPSTTGTFTFTYTFTNGNGCTNSDSRVVTVVDPIQSNAGPDLEACIDAPNVQINGTPLSGTWTGSFVSSTGNFNPTTAGVYPLVLSNGAGNCLTRDTMLFTVHALPVVAVGPDFSFCPSDAVVNFTGAPIGGTWAGTGITNTTNGTFDPSLAGVGSHTIIYTYTNPITTCLNRDTLLAVVHPFPTAQFNYNPVACLGIAEAFTNTSLLGNTYFWDFDDGSTAVSTSPSHTFTSAGFFDVELVVTSAFGCLDSITQSIEVRVPPVADFTLAPDSACGPLTVNFTDLSTGPALSYNWNYGNGTSSTTAIPSTQIYPAGILADTNYTVTLSLTNFCGTDNHSENIQVMPIPLAIFGTNTNIGCSPLTLDFVNNSVGLPDTYEWDFGDGTTGNQSSSTFQHIFTTGVNDTTYTIQLIVSNECGSDTVTHQITVLPNQVNAFFNVDAPSGCVPHTVNLTQFSQGSTFSEWDFGDGNGATSYNATHTFTQAGTYTVSLFANDGCGYDTTTAVITVFPSPVVDFSSTPDSVCINELFTFTNLSSNVASVSWDFGDGTNSILFDPQHAYASSGIFQVTLSGVSQTNGCIGSITKPIVVSLNPVAAFTPNPNAGCEDLTVQFTNQSTSATFSAWSFGDGNFSTLTSPSHTYVNPGNYTVKLYVENANGCSDSLEQIITVYPNPTADFTYTIADPCTQPSLVNFTNTSSGAMNYEWNFGNSTTSTLTNPSATYANSGTYQITLIATSIQGCKDTVVQSLSVYDQAIANFVLPDDSLCAGEPATFISNTQFTNAILWDFGNGFTSSDPIVSYQFPGSGNYNVTLIAYGNGGCNDTLTLSTPIVIVPSPVADFSYVNEQAPDPLSGTVEFTNESVGQTWNQWEFGNGDTSSLLNPIERYNSFGEFLATLIVGNQYGCTDTIQQTITVDFFYGLHIPNAIAPGHGSFEVANFIPKGVGLKTFELLIYDDWGNLIWSTTALDADGRPTEYWDGTYLGAPVQQDAYVWKCTATFMNEDIWEGKEYKNGVLKRSGSITVIR
ncbi:MAG: PKD domain-containing protein [Fluviicola sp.]|nr:PKD domain-containing protein [Fluviicola sp.]